MAELIGGTGRCALVDHAVELLRSPQHYHRISQAIPLVNGKRPWTSAFLELIWPAGIASGYERRINGVFDIESSVRVVEDRR